jgi:hypothetical protein
VLDVLEAIEGPVRLNEGELPSELTAGSVKTLRLVLDRVARDVDKRPGKLQSHLSEPNPQGGCGEREAD